MYTNDLINLTFCLYNINTYIKVKVIEVNRWKKNHLKIYCIHTFYSHFQFLYAHFVVG